MMSKYSAVPMEVHSQLYIGDYFTDTLHFSSHEHTVLGCLLLHLWLTGSEGDQSQIAAAIGICRDEWNEVREAVLPPFHTAAASIGEWKEALRAHDGRRLPPAEWQIIRAIVLMRDSRICTYCGAENASHVDHIIAVSRGGSNAFENLTTSCRPCNQSKGPKTLAAWKAFRMLDINTATADEIDGVAALRGHGYEIARYRTERGRFTELRQLDEVPGLAGKTTGIEEFVRIGS